MLEGDASIRKGQAMMGFRTFALVLPLMAAGAPAFAQNFKAGDIVVEKPWARATPNGAQAAAGDRPSATMARRRPPDRGARRISPRSRSMT